MSSNDYFGSPLRRSRCSFGTICQLWLDTQIDVRYGTVRLRLCDENDNNHLTIQAVSFYYRRRISAYHLHAPLMVVRYLRRLYRDWSRPVRGFFFVAGYWRPRPVWRLLLPVRAWFCMRSLWRRRLAAFERKARYIDRLRYFGDRRCYSEARDFCRYRR